MNRHALLAATAAAAVALASVQGSRAAITKPADPGLTPPAPARGDPTRRIAFTYQASWPRIPKHLSKLDFWVPIPFNGGPQAVSDLVFQAPGEVETGTDPTYGNLMYHGSSGRRGGVAYNVSIHCVVERSAVRFDDLARRPAESAPEPGNLARYLEGDRLASIDGPVRSRAASLTGKLKADHEKARAIYDHLVASMKLVEGHDEWGRGDIQRLAGAMEGSSFDVSALFVGLARASGIPARIAVGLRLPAGAAEGHLSRPHAWVEFWIAGFGWVPADPAAALERPAERDAWFGRLDADRIQMSVGRDIVLAPPHAGDPLDYLLYPYAQADGLPLGGSSYRFAFEPAPPPPEPPSITPPRP